MSVNADFSQVDRLATALAAAGVRAKVGGDKAVDHTGDELLRNMIAAAPVRTGELRGDIRELADGTYGSTVPQGFYQEFGTSVMPPQPWAWPAATTAEKTLSIELEMLADPLL